VVVVELSGDGHEAEKARGVAGEKTKNIEHEYHAAQGGSENGR